MAKIILDNWYQVDIKTKNPHEDLKEIDSIMEELRQEKLITKWFFFLEKPDEIWTIRVRIQSDDKTSLEIRLKDSITKKNLEIYDKWPFTEYSEGDVNFPNKEVIERFALIMCEVTALTVRKLQNKIQFDSSIIKERITHCFDNIWQFLLPKNEFK